MPFRGWLRGWLTPADGRPQDVPSVRAGGCQAAGVLGVGDCRMDAALRGSGATPETDPAAELGRMLTRTDLRDIASDSGALPALQWTCARCADKAACRDWLTVPAKPHDHAAVPGFCPNHNRLNGLRVRQIRLEHKRAGGA